ncbi:MAG TPA: hypothetical protein VM142_10900 [Acidimicrobiales bacterium]|nr:hypothetical protein [Acidimicrobiales bacterium]
MVDAALVERQIADGRDLLCSLDERGFSVFAALWLYQADAGHWLLIVGTTVVDEIGRHAAYEQLQQIMDDTGSGLALREVTLAGGNDPLLQALATAIHVEGLSEIRFSNNMINGVLLPDALIYRLTRPAEAPAPPRKRPKPTPRTGAPATKSGRRRAS